MSVQKDIGSLFGKPQIRSPEDNLALCTWIETWWLRPIRKKPNYSSILDKLHYRQYEDQQVIIRENDKVDHYFYLIDGVANCYKKKQKDMTQFDDHGHFIKQIEGPQPIGESIFSHAYTRTMTYRAMEKVKCCFIEAQTMKSLCQVMLSDNQDFEMTLAEYLGMPLQTIGKLELHRFVKYRTFNLRDKLISSEEKRSNKNVIYFVLEGECRMFEPQISQESMGCYNSVKKLREVALLNICKQDVVGVEILFEMKYRFTYVSMTELLEVLEIQASDYDNFPMQFKEKMLQTYKSHCSLTIKSREPSRHRQFQQNKFLTKSFLEQNQLIGYELNRKEVKHLKAICMFIPNVPVQHSNRKEINSMTLPYSGFIPRKKEAKKVHVLMQRKEWRAYLKLPHLPAKESATSIR